MYTYVRHAGAYAVRLLGYPAQPYGPIAKHPLVERREGIMKSEAYEYSAVCQV